MDPIRSNRCKIYLCVPILTILLAGPIYHVLQETGRNVRELKRVRQDMDDMQFMCGQHKTGKADWELENLKAYVNGLVMQALGTYVKEVQQLKIAAEQFSGKDQLKPEENPLASPHHQRINYAAEELGARILKVNGPLNCGGFFIQWLLGQKFCANPPVYMLQSSMEPGACFCFKGSKATVLIRLAKTIIVDGISLSHVAKERTPNLNIESAPKNFDVQGISLSTDNTVLLGTWTYVNTSSELTQMFNVYNVAPFEKVIFNFNTNHGASHTCIYRIQVHGNPY